jgi:hypothetical protein
MAKKNQPIKCAKCNLEFPDSVLSEEHKNKAFVWDDIVLCKDCLVMMGGNPATASTLWGTQKQTKAKPHDW